MHCIALPAVINLARSTDGDELPLFQHFRSTKTLLKILNTWGKIISVQRHYEVKMCLLQLWKGNLYQSKPVKI